MHQFVIILKIVYLPFQTATSMFLSYTLFELLNVEHDNPIARKMPNKILWLLCQGNNSIHRTP